MFRQIRYFHAVVKTGSFSEAAEECYISQSAISQQIQALEQELGFKLLERNHKKFSLTPAGEYFYRKTLVLVSDYDRICLESAKISHEDETVLRIGYLRCYSGTEFHKALEIFSEKYPDVSVQIEYGNHEELYDMLRTEKVDIVLNDQRRAFSDEYVNMILTTTGSYIEIASRNSLAPKEKIEPKELKDIPCILISSSAQQGTEREYYESVVGFRGEFIYAENLESARLLVIGGKGFMPIEGTGTVANFGTSITRIPLVRGVEQIKRNYCAFWKKDNSGYYIEDFADILKSQFEK